MPQEYEITVAYNEDNLSATFTCPLCGKDWNFPFPARQIFEKPWPPPDMIVMFHLEGPGVELTPCPEFEGWSSVLSVEAIDKFSVKLRLS